MEWLFEISELYLFLILFVSLCLRYVIVAGVSYFWFYIYEKDNLRPYKIQKHFPVKKQIIAEISYSLLTFFIYSLGIWVFLYWVKNDNTKFYSDIEDFGLLYFILSVLIMIVLHDFYFYWTHRLMHLKPFFNWMHLLHHKFKNPTPWSAFAFHPLESVLSMGIIPIIIFLIPWHGVAIAIFITIMIVNDTYIHLGYAIVPKPYKWHNTPLNHDIHHQNSKSNFGLYFTFWDRFMGTYSKSN